MSIYLFVHAGGSTGGAGPSLPPRTSPAAKAPAAEAEPAPAAPEQPPASQAQTGNTMPWSGAQQGAGPGAQNGGSGLPNGTGAPHNRGPPAANGGILSRSGPGASPSGGNPPGGNQGVPATSVCFLKSPYRLEGVPSGYFIGGLLSRTMECSGVRG